MTTQLGVQTAGINRLENFYRLLRVGSWKVVDTQDEDIGPEMTELEDHTKQ